MKTRVTFRFPSDFEVRYLERLPRRGERIRAGGGEWFYVSRVESQGEGEVVITANLIEYAHDVTESARATRERAQLLHETVAGVRRRSFELLAIARQSPAVPAPTSRTPVPPP
jgi:hypothetical protein